MTQILSLLLTYSSRRLSAPLAELHHATVLLQYGIITVSSSRGWLDSGYPALSSVQCDMTCTHKLPPHLRYQLTLRYQSVISAGLAVLCTRPKSHPVLCSTSKLANHAHRKPRVCFSLRLKRLFKPQSVVRYSTIRYVSKYCLSYWTIRRMIHKYDMADKFG